MERHWNAEGREATGDPRIAVALFALVAVSMAAEPEAKENLKGSEAVYVASPYATYAYDTPLAYRGAYHVPAVVPGVYSPAIAPALRTVSYLR
ncbi:hypothetical protein PR048_014921 [Dryococelus australis]|uniref:Uncharacterized protein n=1 Tax=Dryococelus australis TaxID=614101 RepID=A0ABQ9HFH9_9NEOP|nr:hypothetical protein PR048_014921 [Dryococelus australis]